MMGCWRAAGGLLAGCWWLWPDDDLMKPDGDLMMA